MEITTKDIGNIFTTMAISLPILAIFTDTLLGLYIGGVWAYWGWSVAVYAINDIKKLKKKLRGIKNGK